MTVCKYWDAGWCYAPNYVVTSASSQGSCIYPEHCPYLKTEITNQLPEVISSGTAIISDENGVPTKVHLSDKEKLTEMTEIDIIKECRQTGRTRTTTKKLLEKAYETPMTKNEEEIEKTKKEIEVLTKKLSFLEELSKTKTPVEEAYKRIYGMYPETYSDTWSAFQDGYDEAQKDYKVGEYQETAQEPEELKTLHQMFYEKKWNNLSCDEFCDVVKEWMSQYTHNVMTGEWEYLKGYEECLTVLEENLK